MARLSIESPVGSLIAEERDGAIVALDWGSLDQGDETPLLAEAARQLQAYFDGRLKAFDLPLRPLGSDHQQRVWAAMRAIPYGQTRSYGDLAREVSSAPRAVGAACGANPIAIIIPCHRVLAAGGRIGGYSGGKGAETKTALLELEGAAGAMPLFSAPGDRG